MTDPVLDPTSGMSFERKAIEKWLDSNSVSPISRKTLKKSDLIPNHGLRDTITDSLKAKGGGSSSEQNDGKDGNPQKKAAELKDAKLDLSVHGWNAEETKSTDSLDVSGSMSKEATAQGEEGKKESQGMSQLDIVVHAMRTIIAACGDDDILSIVTYSTCASTDLPPMKMTKQGKKAAGKALDNMSPNGQTNLWGGLKMGLDVLETIRDSRNSQSLA
eukprot:jgi/Bigna1/128183/aug1.6_g2891